MMANQIIITIDPDDSESVERIIKMLQAMVKPKEETITLMERGWPIAHRVVSAVSRTQTDGAPANTHIPQQKAGE